MRSNPKCPSSQCKVTDDYVCGAYNTAARVGHLSHLNSLSHLLLALSTSLQEVQVDSSLWDICDVSMQNFAYHALVLGRLMASLTHMRCHVWLAQSSLTKATLRVLCQLPAEPGVSSLDSIGLHR